MSACQWTIPKLEQAIFLLAQPARWGNKLQSRWLDASALNVIYPSGNDWLEEAIAYEQLEEVEVRGPAA
mgnify:CR=1 FL=1